VFLTPSDAEIELLAEVRHCGSFDHASFDRLISVDMPKNQHTAYKEFISSPWPLGLLRSWSKTATGDQRALIRRIAQRHFSHLGDTIPKQFT
jgi:hypothetical protein